MFLICFGTIFSVIIALKSFSDLISSLMEDEIEFSDALSSASNSCASKCLLLCLLIFFFFLCRWSLELFLVNLYVSNASFSSWNRNKLNTTSIYAYFITLHLIFNAFYTSHTRLDWWDNCDAIGSKFLALSRLSTTKFWWRFVVSSVNTNCINASFSPDLSFKILISWMMWSI